MGLINNLKDKAKDKTKNKAKKVMKKVETKIASMIMSVFSPILVYLLLGCIGAMIVSAILDWVVEQFTAENNPKLVYESFNIENVSELITIKGNETDGYYLDFIDGIDEKLKDIVNKYNKSGEYHNLPTDINFLKKMLKAEVYTQFPDLKGTIPQNSEDGFQGAITIRRVTPNKSPRRDEKYWKR